MQVEESAAEAGISDVTPSTELKLLTGEKVAELARKTLDFGTSMQTQKVRKAIPKRTQIKITMSTIRGIGF